jgi:signal transduction histidine kinase
VTGWLAALVLAVVVVRLRRRLELVARAEHELRGPLTAFELALESARRGRPVTLDAELARARAALADLSAARRGRRAAPEPMPVDLEALVRSSAAAWGADVSWDAGEPVVVADRGRVAQALGNLLANAAEHGTGSVRVRVRRDRGRVRVEVANRERGRGLAIARTAARDAGGDLVLARLELPVAT